MFTGIVTDIGTIESFDKTPGGVTLKLICRYDPATIDIGASISCAGICLTVIDKGKREGEGWVAFEASNETGDITTLKEWRQGKRINLERALKVGDELGGHLVLGHVDGVAQITSRQANGDAWHFTIRPPDELSRFIAPKGSVTLDGVSLTVNEVTRRQFDVTIIPHTAKATTWGGRSPGDFVNIEIDQMARYTARLLEWRDQGVK